MKIKTGDTVLLIAGKDKGKKGKVIKIIPKERKVVVEGLNMRKKHVRARRMGEKGQIVSLPAPLDISNVKLVCPRCLKDTRVGYRLTEDKKKFRICKKCGAEI